MKAVLLLLPIFLGLPAVADEPAAVGEARQALAEHIPQVAIFKLQSALQARDFPGAERPAALLLLAEAQLASGKPEATLETLRPFSDTGDPAARLLRAHALAASGAWEKALVIYQSLSSLAEYPAAALGEAECHQALGHTAEAVATLQRLKDSGRASLPAQLRLASLLVELGRPADAHILLGSLPAGDLGESKWRQYIEARILLLEKKPDAALKLSDAILFDKPGLTTDLVAAVTLAGAEARLALSGPEPAAKILEAFLKQNPNCQQLEVVFRRLDQIYARDPDPAEAPLQNLALDRDLPIRTRALAQFYLTRLQLRQEPLDQERVKKSVANFLDYFPGNELTPYIHVVEADLHLKLGQRATEPALKRAQLDLEEKALDDALRTTQSAEFRAELSHRAALINLNQRDFTYATQRLREAANSPRLKQSAAYNSALGKLMYLNYAHFRDDVAAFAREFTAPLLLGQLRLEEGLMLARTRSPEATRVVQDFLRDFPAHPRQDEGRIALAEIAFQEGRTEDAAALAGAVKGTPATTEQSEYLAISLEDAKRPKDHAHVIHLARKFIADHPQSPLLTEVRMKLGQIYFTTDDYLNAQQQFATLAHEQPDSPYAETALFLAGQCGTRMMNTEAMDSARDFFEKVVNRKGQYEAPARLQQAWIKNKLGDFDDAANLCDSVLAVVGVDSETRAAALIGKGDNLVALFQKDAPAPAPAPAPSPAPKKRPASPVRDSYLTQAIAAYDVLLASPGIPLRWSNQAAYKKGKALRQLERNDEALTVFHDILDRTERAQRINFWFAKRETFWFSKAGDAAADILQEQANWEAAASIYKKMARVPGPHATHAADQVKKLKLEHFLFDF